MVDIKSSGILQKTTEMCLFFSLSLSFCFWFVLFCCSSSSIACEKIGSPYLGKAIAPGCCSKLLVKVVKLR